MTTLTITPNWKNKTARFKGTIAAGEHVAVRIVNDNGEGDEYITDTTNLRLRVVNPANGKTLAQFPMPEPEEEILPTVALEDEGEDAGEDSGETGETGETGEETSEESGAESPTVAEAGAWSELTPLSCTLNLNTDRMLMAVPPGANVPLLFVLDAYEGATDEDEGEFTLYFKDFCEVTHWPRRRGEDEPMRLDDYKDLIKDFRERIDAAEESIRDKVDEANGIVAHVDAAKTDAQNSATAAGNSASNAQTSAATAKNWVTGGGETGDPGATNNAKYYAQQAGASATNAGNSATSAATAAANAEAWAVGKRNGVDVPSTDATYENNAKHYAAAAAASAQEAEETLESKADASDLEDEVTRATEAEEALADDLAGAFTAATYNSTTKKIVFTKQGGTTAEIDASNFIKDGMVSSVAISNGNLVITFNTDAGQDPISIPLTNIFNPANYYDKTSADNKFVAKETGKRLMTDAEGTKLSGVETGAKDNVVEAASASAFPQTGVTGKIYVAKDENKTYRWNGTQYVQIGGGGGGSSVDVVPPSTDPADAGKAADAKATGDALAGKRSLADMAVYAETTTWAWTGEDATAVAAMTAAHTYAEWDDSLGWVLYDLPEDYQQTDYPSDGDATTIVFEVDTSISLASMTGTRSSSVAPVTGDALAKTSQVPTTPADIGAATAAQGAKADTAVQPAALAGAVRYDLGGVELASGLIETDSSDPSNPIDYVALTLNDREVGRLVIDEEFDELRLVFPTADSDKVRDFGLLVEVDADKTAPALTLVQPSGTTIVLVNPDGAMPTLADGDTAGDESGKTILYFSEVSANCFLVKGEEVKEVS